MLLNFNPAFYVFNCFMFDLFLGYIYLHVFLYIVRSTMEIR